MASETETPQRSLDTQLTACNRDRSRPQVTLAAYIHEIQGLAVTFRLSAWGFEYVSAEAPR